MSANDAMAALEAQAAGPGRQPTVSVILVSYNTVALLEPCLERLAAATARIDAQVMLVDNASRDDSVALLRRDYGRFDIVANDVNVGFGRANNQVLDRVRGRYVLLLNTDAYVEPDTLDKTIAYMDAHPRCGVLGVRLVGADGALQPSCRYFPTPWNKFLTQTGAQRLFPGTRLVDDMGWDHATVRQCDWVPGCYYLVRKEVIDAVGLFDPRFFLYFEEVDHCRAVKQAGWDVTYFPDTTVVHLGGESAKSEAGQLDQGKQISTLQTESEFLYFRKHHGAFGAWSALALSWVANLVTAIRRTLRRRPGRPIAEAWRNMRQSGTVFMATHAGRQPTR